MDWVAGRVGTGMTGQWGGPRVKAGGPGGGGMGGVQTFIQPERVSPGRDREIGEKLR